jgi:hypothetical protein
MLSLKSFLIESIDDANKQLSHLDHPYQQHVIYGLSGARAAVKNLKDTHEFFKTGVSNKVSTSRKVDGGVSVILSKKNGQFSVATKSAFNKNPKINYTPADVDKNHGHAPGLADTLKHVLKHGKDLINDGHTVQGDLLYTHDSKKPTSSEPVIQNNKVSVTPNRMTLSHSGSPKSMGIALHTTYDEEGTARSGVSSAAINHTKDVFVADTSFHPEPHHYSEEQQKIAEDRLSKAQKILDEHPEHFKLSDEHTEHTLTYMNALRTEDGKIKNPTIEGYINHLNNIKNKEVSKVKTDKSKTAKANHYNKLANEVEYNKPKFQNNFDFHDHLNAVTEALSSSLDKNKASNFNTEIDGKPSTDEGVVVANAKKGNILFKIVPNKVASALRFNPRFARKVTQA